MKQQVAIVHSNLEQARICFIDWHLGNVCNYECSYCPKHLHDGSIKWPATADVIALAEKIVAHCGDLGKTAYFKFTAGEPSLYKGMLEVLGRLRQLGAFTALNSNGSRELAWWESAIPLLSATVLTYHVEFAEPEHFAEVTSRLLEASIPTHVNVTMLPERFDECVANARHLVARCKGMSIALKPLLKGFGSEMYPYSAEQKKQMGSFGSATMNRHAARGNMRCLYDDDTSEILSPYQLLLRGENRWSSWTCNAGIEALSVGSDGHVYRAVCRQGGSIGSLHDDEITFPASPIVCAKDSCHCLSDIRITKWRERIGLDRLCAPATNPKS